MLVRLNEVVKKEGKRTFATTATGKALFPQRKDMEIKVGQFAIVTPTMQTKKYEGTTLVDIPVEQQKMVNIINSVFNTKPEAIAALVEEQSGDLEVQYALAEMSKEFGLNDIKALEKAGI